MTLDGHTERISAGDTVIVNPGATLAVENPADHTAVSWVTTSVGLEARLADGTRLTPPWADRPAGGTRLTPPWADRPAGGTRQAARVPGITARGPNFARARSATSSIRRAFSSTGSKVSW